MKEVEACMEALLKVFPTTDGAGWDQLPHHEWWARDRAEKLLTALEEKKYLVLSNDEYKMLSGKPRK